MLIDVRSPAEYAHAHIPGAHNIPLFSNEERHQVGLTYKKAGAQPAFDLGLRLVGPKMADFVSQARQFESLEVYCWRGGMRSQSMGWLFAQAGIPTTILPGGYKAYRNEVLALLKKRYHLRILTGFTGSGKTEILRTKEQFIDLEELANHRGSAFGSLGIQPSNEQFENLIADKLINLNHLEPIWIEDESRMLGSCKIPDDFFDQMKNAPRITLFCSIEERVKRLVNQYGDLEEPKLEKAIRQLEKRMGTVRMLEAINYLKIKDLHSCVRLLLQYYDKAYEKSQKRYNKDYEYAFSK